MEAIKKQALLEDIKNLAGRERISLTNAEGKYLVRLIKKDLSDVHLS